MRATGAKGSRASTKSKDLPNVNAEATCPAKTEKGTKRRAADNDEAADATTKVAADSAAPRDQVTGDGAKHVTNTSKGKVSTTAAPDTDTAPKGKRLKGISKDAAPESAGAEKANLKNEATAPSAAPAAAAGKQDKKRAAGEAPASEADAAGKGQPASAGPFGKERKGKKRAGAKTGPGDEDPPAKAAADDAGNDLDGGGDAPRCRGGGTSRRAAQRVKSYKEAGDADGAPSDGDEEMEDVETVKVREMVEASTEDEALRLTAPPGDTGGLVSGGSTKATMLRSLLDFTLVDSEGRPEPLDRLSSVQGGLFISGLVEAVGPRPAAKGKAKGAGASGQQQPACGRCRAMSVGPVRDWRIKYSPEADPQVVLVTELAQYECGKPTAAYRKLLEPLLAQIELAGAVHKALCPAAAGGRPDASFEDVCCRVARTKVSKQYGGARFALKLNGRFVLEQLAAMTAASRPQGAAGAATAVDKGKGAAAADKGKGAAAAPAYTYDSGPFAKGLLAALETEDHMPLSKESLAMLMGGGGGGIRIATDGGGGGTVMETVAAGGSGGGKGVDEDFELACRLMAEEYADHMNGGGRNAGGRRRGGAASGAGSKAEPYIQVREEEIADDYPEPAEYKGEDGEDEWDELILEDPDLLGCGFHGADDRENSRTLDHFAIYNADGFLTSLELVPMVAGLDVEVNIFASGVLAEDSGDWGAAEQQQQQQQEGKEQQGDGAGGSSSGAGGSGAGGSGAGGSGSGSGSGSGHAQRYFLTQIREWFVECGPGGQVVVNIRTDVSWYRLVRPQKQYARWYGVVQRASHIAVQILTWLDEQDRAARLSFQDVVARLAALPPGHAARVSAKIDAVERFVVVHGQVILNLINRHYKETVRRSGFAKALRAKLAERRHRKLAAAGGGRGAKGFRGAAAKAPKAAVENPVKARQEKKAGGRPVAMPATTTAQVHRIWSDYFAAPASAQHAGDQPPPPQLSEPGAAAAATTGEGGSSKGAVAAATPATARRPKARSMTWTLADRRAADKTTGRTMYGAAVCGEVRLTPGSIIRVGALSGRSDDSDSSDDSDEDMEEPGSDAEEPKAADGGAAAADAAAKADAAARRVERLTRGPFGLVQCIFTESEGDNEGSPKLQVRRVVHGRDTMLVDVAARSELFLLDRTPMPAVPASRGGGWPAGTGAAGGAPVSADVAVMPLNGRSVAEVVEAKLLTRPAKHSTRLDDAKADLERLRKDEERLAAGRPPLFVYRSVYCPLQGKFRELQIGDLALGSYVQVAPSPPTLELLPGGEGFIKDGVTYRVGDFLYVRPAAVDRDGQDADGSSSSSSDSESVSDPDSDDGDPDTSSSSDDDSEDDGGEGVDEEVREAARRKQPARGRKKQAGAAAKGGRGKVEAGKKKKESKRKPAAKVAAKAKGKAEDDAREEDEEEDAAAESAGEGEEEGAAMRRKHRKSHKGSNEGLRAFQVVQLLSVEGAKTSRDRLPSSIKVRRFYRPEDVSREVAYRADWWDIYAPAAATGGGAAGASTAAASAAIQLGVGDVYGKCAVLVGRPRPKNPVLDTFRVVGSYDPARPGKTGPPPASLAVPPLAPVTGKGGKGGAAAADSAAVVAAAAASSADGGAGGDDDVEERIAEALKLDTLDIFAGCGGLSEGMHQAGVARTRWAIEYERDAAEAFKLNNPEAKVFCNNCNVLLRAAMAKAGMLDDCVADPVCIEAATRLDEASCADLPTPGSVGYMMGGPPCQGYSGMNRFNKGNWSQVQNSMVMAYLSFCDFYRPRYFLLENVRNFVSYNGGRVFRLVVRTLLDLGYQVRFGVLNAGNFGAPQSRKRTFIWAAAPGELLPDWPTPRHVFMSAQLGVRMVPPGRGDALGLGKALGPGGYFFASGPPLPGAPLRTVTVRDAIGDLPPVDNDAKEEVMPYTGEPASAYQRAIRGSAGSELRDHIVKPMNELNLERCKCIPKGVPGADWRVLQEIVAKDPSRDLFKGQPLVPWCLPNTAARHNDWRGLYGRLDPDGHFPTATTDPNPMGKVGQVFHPDQDRIVSVRECSRSQGFPDHFRFYGSVQSRHRQVGNAVPPPLARALGQQLLLALKERRARDARKATEQMQAMRGRRQQQQQKAARE